MVVLELYGIAAITVFVIVTLLWLISVPIKDASIIDMAWGPLFAAIAWVLLPAYGGGIEPKPYLVLLLVTLWGLRLGFHLISRNLFAGEDKRYARWRSRGGPRWWLKTYYRIFLLQGFFALCVATPVVAAYAGPTGISVVTVLGVLVWAGGFGYELVADVQLTRFKSKPENRGKLMDRGLWGLSRHPNYFGDAVQWWGLGIVALSAETWWALIGPAVMSALFAYLTADVLERGMSKRHGKYAEYVTQTNKFIPKVSRLGTHAS